jgi:hypothetical protein
MQSVSQEERAAQGTAVQSLLGSAGLQHPPAASEAGLLCLKMWRGRRGSNPRPLA